MYNTITRNPRISMPISDEHSDGGARPRGRRKRNEFRFKTELTRRFVRQLATWWALTVFLLAMVLLGFEASRIGLRPSRESTESSSEFTRLRSGFTIVKDNNLNRLDHTYHTVAVLSNIRSVKVYNLSLGASEKDVKEFFSFSGDIEHVEIQSGNERSQTAYVTFKEAQGAETAALLSGATIVGQAVTIALAPDYIPPATTSASFTATKNNLSTVGSPVRKAENVVTLMLAKGFVLGKDALSIAKAFDETHQFTSTAAATVASIDQKIGLSEKISLVKDKMREVDQKFQVSEKTKSVLEAAEQTVSSMGSAIMKNRYILTGTSWVTGAFDRVSKATEDVSQKTRENTGGGRKMKKHSRGLL